MSFVRISDYLTIHFPKWGYRDGVRPAHKGCARRTPHTESKSESVQLILWNTRKGFGLRPYLRTRRLE